MTNSDSIKELAAALAKAQASGDHHREAEAILMFADIRNGGKPRRTRDNAPLTERFFNHLAFTSNDCWLWLRYRDALGYGRVDARKFGENKAHRYAWILFNGPIPAGMHVLHRCDVRCCVNPEHLFLGTHTDNMRDCAAKGRLRPTRLLGERNPMAKLTSDIVCGMRRIRESTGMGYKQIAERFGVSTMTAFRAITGESWK